MPKIIKDGVVYGASPSENVWEGTMAEYNLIPVKDPNTAYYITDEDPYPNTNAGVISYDNTNSGLSAVNVQSAIDEIVSKNITITKDSAISSVSVTATKNNKMVCGSIDFTGNFTTNTWINVGVLSVVPNQTARCPTVDSQGNYGGLLAIDTTGAVSFFPKVTGTGRGMYASFAFRIT